jgi:hypothetical protein
MMRLLFAAYYLEQPRATVAATADAWPVRLSFSKSVQTRWWAEFGNV